MPSCEVLCAQHLPLANTQALALLPEVPVGEPLLRCVPVPAESGWVTPAAPLMGGRKVVPRCMA